MMVAAAVAVAVAAAVGEVVASGTIAVESDDAVNQQMEIEEPVVVVMRDEMRSGRTHEHAIAPGGYSVSSSATAVRIVS